MGDRVPARKMMENHFAHHLISGIYSQGLFCSLLGGQKDMRGTTW
jgi:hypothetical protein